MTLEIQRETLLVQPLPLVAYIRMKGAPYQRELVDGGRLITVDCNLTADRLASTSGYVNSLRGTVSGVENLLGPLFEGGYHAIDERIKHGEDLAFDEAFSALTFVCAALNQPLNNVVAPRIKNLTSHETHLLQATALLSALSAKEAYRGLTSQEIAGFVAATIHLDTFVRLDHGSGFVVGFGGMGGDKGYSFGTLDTKLFSLSTLAAIAMSVDVSVHKHHSYPNTSKVAGQSAIEGFGARSDFYTREAMRGVVDRAGLFMSSCHDTRTLHTLSHLLKGETINHVIGPLAFPVDPQTPLGAMIGVNEKIHPNTIVESMLLLHKTEFQRYVNGVAFCGTDLKAVDPLEANNGSVDNLLFKKHVRIDELAPPPYVSIASFLRNGQNLEDLLIPNTREAILDANRSALAGVEEVKAKYLAMTIGLGLFLNSKLALTDSLDLGARRVNRAYMRECTQRGLDILHRRRRTRAAGKVCCCNSRVRRGINHGQIQANF